MPERTTMDHDALREEARRLVKESNLSQNRIGEKLGVSSGAMARALSESGSKFEALQMRIIEYLSGKRLQKRTIFEVEEPDD